MRSKNKPALRLKHVMTGSDYIRMEFSPEGIIPRGVQSANMTMGGDFVVTIGFDRETAKQALARKRENEQMIEATIDAMSVKAKRT